MDARRQAPAWMPMSFRPWLLAALTLVAFLTHVPAPAAALPTSQCAILPQPGPAVAVCAFVCTGGEVYGHVLGAVGVRIVATCNGRVVVDCASPLPQCGWHGPGEFGTGLCYAYADHLIVNGACWN
jgi:hypothetical protein